MSVQEVIRLNVGGTPYEVTLSTLMKFPDTMLAALASERWRQHSDRHELIFIDRDGDLFRYILAWYHDNEILIPRTVAAGAVANEVRFFSLPDTAAVEQEEIPIAESVRDV
jgi:hypothetical protein